MHLSNTVAAINNLNYVKAILRLSADKGRAGYSSRLVGRFLCVIKFSKTSY